MKQEARSREVLLPKRKLSLNVSPGEIYKLDSYSSILFACGKQNFAEPCLCVVQTLIHENNLVGQLTIRSTRWRVEFQENLARKDAEEKTKMEELKAKAKKELEDW